MQCYSKTLEDKLRSSESITFLADIFDEVFHYFCTHNSPFAKDYLKGIKIIIGLGFTSVLTNDICVSTYRNKMNVFFQYCDFKVHKDNIRTLSMSIAEMLNMAFNAFHCINYPSYYQNFFSILIDSLNHIAIDLSEKSEVFNNLLQTLNVRRLPI